MFPYPVLYDALFFTVPAAKRSEIIEWVLSADETFMRDQLTRRGKTNVIRVKGQPAMLQLTELPPRDGTYTPYYGMVGGVYNFYFLPQSEDTLLRVEHAEGERLNLPPYETLLGTRIQFASSETPTNNCYMVRLELLMEDPFRDYYFHIDGDTYQKMLEAGWTKQTLENYRYEFVPLTIGCVILLHHLPSGVITELTKDVNW